MTCDSIAEILGASDKYAAHAASNPNGVGGAAGGETGETDPELECEFKVKHMLTWILCPVIKGINLMVSALDNFIISLLTIDQEAIFDRDTDTGSRYYTAWQTFRSFALAVLVIAALFMVIAQALGFEILDAYAIKKLLPRLIIAIIAIALSWEIMGFFIAVVNDIGIAVRNIIYYPFRDFPGAGNLGTGASLAIHLITAAAFKALGPVGLLSFAGTALLAIAVAVLVLIIRQLVVVILILFAPSPSLALSSPTPTASGNYGTSRSPKR